MSAVQTVVINTWRGLVQRRLLPVAAVLLAAMVAVPLLLSRDPEPAPVLGGVAASKEELVAAPIVAAASATDRERDRRVLGERKNPFKHAPKPKKKKANVSRAGAQSNAKPSNGGVSGSPGSISIGGGSIGGGSIGGTIGGGSYPRPASPASEPTQTEQPPADPKPQFEDNSLMVRWGSADTELTEVANLERHAALMVEEEPVVIYLGLLEDAKTAVFLVDSIATSEGDGECQPDPADCQRLELKEGETSFFEVKDEAGAVTQHQLDLVEIVRNGTKAAEAVPKRPAVKRPAVDGLIEAVDGEELKAALEAISDEIEYRYNRKSGLLELVAQPS
ncbi:MAG: hypothetical protein M3P40_06550 [Actinomycetota bacterium]|nr:hypothetical protein [Actinomycetota bacterium]